MTRSEILANGAKSIFPASVRLPDFSFTLNHEFSRRCIPSDVTSTSLTEKVSRFGHDKKSCWMNRCCRHILDFAAVRLCETLCEKSAKTWKICQNRENNNSCNFSNLASDEEFVKLRGNDFQSVGPGFEFPRARQKNQGLSGIAVESFFLTQALRT